MTSWTSGLAREMTVQIRYVKTARGGSNGEVRGGFVYLQAAHHVDEDILLRKFVTP